MKILVLSDTQIGSGRNLAVDRLADQEAVLNEIAELADAEKVDLVIHAGDVHDSRSPSEEARIVFRNFARRISLLRRFVIVAGNHDLRGAAGASPVDQHDDCYTFVREPNVLRLDGLTLGCLPWVPSAHYKAKLPKQLPHAELNDRIAELLVDVAQDLRDSCEDGFAMMVGHWPVSGGVLPTGLPVEQIPGPVLALSAIEALEFDLAAFGDIHHPAMIGRNVLSLGGTQVDNWGDVGVEHGVWIVDTADVIDGVRFVPIADRRFVTVDCDLTDEDQWTVLIDDDPNDPTDVIASAVVEHFPLTDATVRLRVKATAEQIRRVDFAAIRRLADDAGVHRLVIAPPDVERVERARVEGVTETLSVPEALDLYIEANFETAVGQHQEPLRVLTSELLEEVQA